MLPTIFEQAQRSRRASNGEPLAVLTAGSGNQRGWMAAQCKLARLSTNSIHRTAAGATHAELLETPRFATITTKAIRSVVEAAR